jgi:hypothetical protein
MVVDVEVPVREPTKPTSIGVEDVFVYFAASKGDEPARGVEQMLSHA